VEKKNSSTSTSGSKWFAVAAADGLGAAMLAILAGFSFYRADLVDAVFGSYATCPHCFDASVWANDALVFAALALLVGISRTITSAAGRALLALIAVTAAIAYVGDIFLFRLLNHRLLVVDVVHFAPDAEHMWSVARLFFQQQEGLWFGAACVALIVTAGLGIWIPARTTRRFAWPLVAVLLALAWAFVPQAHYIHNEAFRNLWQVNRDQDPSRAYSRAFWQRADKMPPREVHCEPGRQDSVSVVLVVVESLSSYHSQLFSGLRDLTPNLDRIARGGAYFKNFYANGYSTETGLISLLTGHLPIPTAGLSGGVMAFTDVQGDFHRWLASRGYETAFFTSGEIGVGERDRWLRAIGIQHAEGAEAAFYNGLARGSFGAAEDAALIGRFLEWDAGRGQGRPFMATVLTVATHPPFYSPASGRQDEGASFREVDRQLARLAVTLEERGFFDHGVMVVVGDHRAMTPIPAEEFDRLGPSAPVRVPALAIGRTGLSPGEYDEPVQQTDLIPSLRHLIANESCRTTWQGQFLGGPVESPGYLVHDDPLQRNVVVLEDANREYRILLDGDDTRWVETPPSKPVANAVLAEVNRERMSRMKGLDASPPGR
jgi:hypothetical protein